MTGIQYAVSVLVPVAIAVCVWVACRRAIQLRWVALALFLGALSVFPTIRFETVADRWVKNWPGHFYADELVRQFLTTAVPEEWIKGMAAVLVWLSIGKPSSPLAWLSCAAASHCGFAIVEGLLGTFGDEGPLKVIVGRSLGTACHCSWGVIAAWFAYRGWNRGRFCALFWPIALLFPAVLHSILNASIMELPPDGPSDADNATSVTELLIVLSGMASMLVTFTLAVWCVYATRSAPASLGNCFSRSSI